MSLSYQEMERILMDELRLYHHPIAVSWLKNDAELEAFKKSTAYVTPVKPLTFCQWEIAARMQAKTVLGTPETLGCANGKISFGWKEVGEKDIALQQHFCIDKEQAERFIRSKAVYPANTMKAVAVGPLGKAGAQPDVVHFYCDNMQSYHLAVDYMASTNTHPLRPNVTMNSSACGGCVYACQENTFNMCPSCPGSYNSGKTERGEVNVFIPGGQIAGVVQRLLDRKKAKGSAALTRPGDSFPGADICKNCPLIIFKEGAGCADCPQAG